MLVMFAVGCLFDRATYEARLRELTDADGDGYAFEVDCDDDDATVSPDAAESCDGVDQDCDGVVDDGFAGAAELCNGIDDDCDGATDEDGVDASTWYNDADGDGHGLASALVLACSAPAGFVAQAGDCDDGNAARHPGGEEIAYDGIDQDCDGADLVDVDGDGYPALLVGGFDCDDEDVEVYPNAEETWENGFVDNDCDPETEGGVLEFDSPRWVGSTDAGQFGYVLSPLADLDSDGTMEFAASALFDGTAGDYAGQVFILNQDSKADLSDAAAVLPDLERSFLGVAAVVGPDSDGDGVVELAVAGDGRNDGRGAVWLLDAGDLSRASALQLPGPARAWMFGEDPSTYLGHAMAVLPDFEGDGIPTLAVSAPSRQVGNSPAAGRVWLLAWQSEGAIDEATANGTASGYYTGEQLGVNLQALSDIDSDGLQDYLVGSSAGDIATVLPGGLVDPVVPDDAIFRLTGSGAGETAECSAVGDADGDAVQDLVCAHAGGFWVFTHLWLRHVVVPDDADLTLHGENEHGRARIDLGDRDADGRSETWLTSSDGPDGAGRGVVLPGDAVEAGIPLGLDDLTLTATPDTGYSRYGFSSFLLPADATHAEVLVLGGPSRDEGGTDRGAVATIGVPGG